MWIWLDGNFYALIIIISIIGLLITITGGGLALLQWRHNTALKRAEMIKQIIDKLRYDKDIADIIYDIEYDKFEYSKEFHGGTHLEQRVDNLLSLLDYACYLRTNRILYNEEFSILEYRIVWVLGRPEIQAY